MAVHCFCQGSVCGQAETRIQTQDSETELQLKNLRFIASDEQNVNWTMTLSTETQATLKVRRNTDTKKHGA